MNLLSVIIALFAAADAAPSSSHALDTPKTTADTSCVDNASFSLNENPIHDCEWIMENSNRREKHCPIQEVRDNCPIACGVCCEDRIDFLFEFPIGNGEDLKNCSWLLHNDKTQCLSESNGVKMMYACPKSCNACQDPVPLEVQWEPKETKEEAPGKGHNLYKKAKQEGAENADIEFTDKATETKRRDEADAPSTTSHLSPASPDSPTQCSDDVDYVVPFNSNVGCELYNNTDCTIWGALLTGVQLQDVFTRCPISCGLPCRYVIFAEHNFSELQCNQCQC